MKKQDGNYILSEEEYQDMLSDLNIHGMMTRGIIENVQAQRDAAANAIGKIQLPSYFSVLPAEIRYDRNLKWFDKILFSEISSLTTVKRYCFATNLWFAKVFGVSDQTVTRSIQNLSRRGYIHIDIDKKEGNMRKIYDLTLSKYRVTPPLKNEVTPPLKNESTRTRVKDSFKEPIQVYSKKNSHVRATNKPDVQIEWLESYIQEQE